MQLFLVPPFLFWSSLPIGAVVFYLVKYLPPYFIIWTGCVPAKNSVCTIVSCTYLLFLLVCSYLAPSFVLLFSDQSSVARVCDKKVLINQYHSPNVITFFSQTLQYGKKKHT